MNFCSYFALLVILEKKYFRTFWWTLKRGQATVRKKQEMLQARLEVALSTWASRQRLKCWHMRLMLATHIIAQHAGGSLTFIRLNKWASQLCVCILAVCSNVIVAVICFERPSVCSTSKSVTAEIWAFKQSLLPLSPAVACSSVWNPQAGENEIISICCCPFKTLTAE